MPWYNSRMTYCFHYPGHPVGYCWHIPSMLSRVQLVWPPAWWLQNFAQYSFEHLAFLHNLLFLRHMCLISDDSQERLCLELVFLDGTDFLRFCMWLLNASQFRWMSLNCSMGCKKVKTEGQWFLFQHVSIHFGPDGHGLAYACMVSCWFVLEGNICQDYAVMIWDARYGLHALH